MLYKLSSQLSSTAISLFSVGENDKQRTRGCVFLQKFSPAKKAGINHHRFLYGQGRDQKTKARKHTKRLSISTARCNTLIKDISSHDIAKTCSQHLITIGFQLFFVFQYLHTSRMYSAGRQALMQCLQFNYLHDNKLVKPSKLGIFLSNGINIIYFHYIADCNS